MTGRQLAIPLLAGVLIVGAAGSLLVSQPAVRTSLGLLPSTMYENPILDRDFPDPAVLRASDGAWYAYATQTITADSAAVNIQVASSADLVTWEWLGDALPAKPDWASTTQDFWAPHVVERDGQFVMYYSAEPDTVDGLCLAIATAASPGGPFTDVGQPLECGEGFTDIDPMAFQDPADQRWWLYWGSGFEPIQVRELAADGLGFAAGSEATVVLEPDPYLEYENLIEGPWVVARDDWYVMFYAGDSCCVRPRYAVLVARSRAVTGPFEKLAAARDEDSSAILSEEERWDAPGHNAVVSDAAGQDWLLYHAIDREQRFGHGDSLMRKMLLDPIRWVDGWPMVDGGVASDGPRSGPVQP